MPTDRATSLPVLRREATSVAPEGPLLGGTIGGAIGGTPGVAFRGALALAVALVFGGGGLSAQTPNWVAYGDHALDGAGSALAALPDADGDGRPDLIIGAPGDGSDATGPGEVRVRSSATGAQLLRLVPLPAVHRFGAAVAGLPDLNGDGIPDVAVGAPGSAAPPTAGRVQVRSGAGGALLLDLSASAAPADDAFGAALAVLPAFGGDAGPELFIGAPADAGTGRATVRNAATGAVLLTLSGDDAGDRFGAALSSAGDVNGDGTPDLLVGAPGGLYARVFSGLGGGVLLTLPGSGGDFGAAVAPAGDVDGDGHDDLAIGAPGLHSVDILSGANGALLRRFTRDGAFGSAIAAAGDWNGDGTDDLLVGAPNETVAGAAGAGNAYAISGAEGFVLLKAPGGAAGEHQGAAVAVLGIAGAGPAPDLAIGAPGAASPGLKTGGATRTYSGKLVGAILPYGIGCPGSFLITPRLDLTGDPLPGGEVTLSITKALGGSFALLFIGGGQGETPFINGCILWVAPLLVTPITVPLQGPGPGAGFATLTGRLPETLPSGFVLSFQAVIADDGADGGIAATSAIQLTIP